MLLNHPNVEVLYTCAATWRENHRTALKQHLKASSKSHIKELFGYAPHKPITREIARCCKKAGKPFAHIGSGVYHLHLFSYQIATVSLNEVCQQKPLHRSGEISHADVGCRYLEVIESTGRSVREGRDLTLECNRRLLEVPSHSLSLQRSRFLTVT